MKKIFYVLGIVSLLTLTSNPAHAQAWERNSKVLSLGFGSSKFFHIDDYYYYGDPNDYHRWYWPTTGQINFQGEFGIHKYVGLGFTTGVGGRTRGEKKGGKDELYYKYSGEVNVPIGMLVNFHFYQLIADNSSKNIHADKLDIYAGANLGSGLAFTYYENTSRTTPLAFGGLQVGIRYYFTEKVGVNGEFGWGKSIVNVGFVFKL